MIRRRGNGFPRALHAVAYSAGTAVALALLGGCATTEKTELGFPLVRPDSPFAPKGCPWTILCLELRGSDRMGQAEQIAATLHRTPGIRRNEVVVTDEGDGAARVYYGVYYRRTDPATGEQSIPKRLADDLQFVKELATPSGEHYFIFARKVRVPRPDVGDPAWALKNAHGVYSLQVAVFEPTDEFWDYKLAAADYCAELRRRGYEAYYHHGDGASMVTVGAFGADAITVPQRGLPLYRADIIAMQEDEALKYNLLNGRVYRAKADDGTAVPVRSRLVEIPRDDQQWAADRPSS